MRILALDCSAKAVSAAVAENGKLISEAFLNIKLTHSETLMPLCRQVVSNAKLTLPDIDAFAVSAGPGSFTGIRIGISAVKGLAFSKNSLIFPFSSLESMALALNNCTFFNGIVCALMDARREQFYNALFEINGGKIIRLCADRTISAKDLETELKKSYNSKNIVLMGDGAELFKSLCPNTPNMCFSPEGMLIQRAAGMAVKASLPNCNIIPVSPAALMPVYLRPSQAERELSQKLSATQSNT